MTVAIIYKKSTTIFNTTTNKRCHQLTGNLFLVERNVCPLVEFDHHLRDKQNVVVGELVNVILHFIKRKGSIHNGQSRGARYEHVQTCESSFL